MTAKSVANFYKGGTPIEKNVIVVDEQGNEYEATYPKRARGLVKNGRARFVAENKICLACPPNENLEEHNHMSDTINNVSKDAILTEKEIFDQIVFLQKQLTENSPTSLHRLGEALYEARGEGDEMQLSDDQVAEICKVFAQREETLNQMLRFYQSMYNDLKKEKQEAKKVAPESEAVVKRREEFLKFVQNTTVATAGASAGPSPAFLPDFEKLWKIVFLQNET